MKMQPDSILTHPLNQAYRYQAIIRCQVRTNQEQMGYLLAVAINDDRSHLAGFLAVIGQEGHAARHFYKRMMRLLQANQAALK